MQINLPKKVEFIINEIYKNGYEAFIVGGCVRDSILGVNPNDYDITTNAKPNKIIEIFKDYKIIDNGIKHGTVGVIIDKEVYEITTYRIEGEYEDNRRPKDVEFTSDIIQDLKRRDFTINAMAYNHKKGLIDEFEGVKDLQRKIIKTVGNPDERFNEDGLRIIRAIRFSAKLKFEIQKETLKSIYDNANIIKKISKERITDEINKIILSENPGNIILLYKTNIFQSLGIYCYLDFDEYNEFEKKVNILRNYSENLEQRLLMLEYLMSNKVIIDKEDIYVIKYEKEIKPFSMVNKLRYSKYTTDYCNKLMQYMFLDEKKLSLIQIKYILSKIGMKNLRSIINAKIIYHHYITKDNEKYNILNTYIKELDNIELKNECYTIKNLDIDGNIIAKLGYNGIEIGKKLEYLLKEVIKNPNINKKEILINLIK